MTVISYPIPPYQNVPITPQYYQPSAFVITNITLGWTTLVTTATDTNYVIGQQVRLVIPSNFGCQQLNGLSGYVISFPSPNICEININSSQNVQIFNLSAIATVQSPQILAIGDVNSGITSTTGPNIPLVTIPGAFINISPE